MPTYFFAFQQQNMRQNKGRVNWKVWINKEQQMWLTQMLDLGKGRDG